MCKNCVEGSPENPVVFQGDRLELSYNDDPGQWDRIWLMEAREGFGHSINNAIIKNGFIGIQAQRFLKDNMAPLYINNTIIDNHTGMGLYTQLYNLKATNFVISNCGNYGMALTGGGEYIFEQGTLANYWNKSTRTTPSLLFNNVYNNPTDGYSYAYNFFFEMNNCIMSGNRDEEFATDFYPGPDTTYSPSIISTSNLRKIFVNLIREKVSIKDIIFVFERLCDYARFSKEPDILSERLRAALGRQICLTNVDRDKTLFALTLSPEWEKTLD